MGWSIVDTSGHGCNFTFWEPAAGSTTRNQMIVYTNDTGAPVKIDSCFMYMATGNGTFTDSSSGTSQTGSGYTYYVTASITDSKGITHTAAELTINNVSNSSYNSKQKYEWTFSTPVLVDVGATVYVAMTFRIPSWDTIVLIYGTWSSSYYGGSVSSAGMVRIYTGSGGDNGWHYAIPYIYTGSGGTNGWHQTMPYVYTGSGGTNGWHIAN